MENAVLVSTVLLILYGLLAGVDGFYLHAWRYQLHERPSSRKEHVAHTARAVMFPVIVALLYLTPPSGALLWAGAAALALDLVMAVGDVMEEPNSRAELGGLSGGEYLLHVLLTLMHGASMGLILVAQPAAAWQGTGAAVYPELATQLGALMLPGAVISALLHLWLCWRGRPRLGFEKNRVAAMVPPPPAVGG